MITLQTESINDFTSIALENNLNLEKVFCESMLEIMSYEAEYINTCLEMGYIVTEALDEIDVEVKKKRNIIDRIFDAIEALFGSFKEKVKILVNKNEQWLRTNLVNINKDSISKLGEVEMFPYWERTADEIFNQLQSLTNTLVSSTKSSPEKFKDIEEIQKLVKQKVGSKNDLATDAKNFFRTGKVDGEIKPITIQGEKLAGQFGEMYNYCIKYDKIVVPKVNKYMNSMKNTVRSLTNNAKTESFCFLENAYYSNTELGYLPDFSIVLENENEDKEMKNGKINDNKSNLTSVKVNKDTDTTNNGENQKDNKETNSDMVQYCKNMTNVLKILQGAAVTVLEEKYVAYINLFKAVVNNDKANKKETEKNEEK